VLRGYLRLAAKFSFVEGTIFGLARAIGKNPAEKFSSLPQKREIDVVYLWVDDQDPTWQKKRAGHRPAGESAVSSAKSRFRQFEELICSIQLLAANAPFVKRVFVVVDEQQPRLEKITRELPFEVVVVNHAEFIPAKYLPTFNSRAIAAHLHLIPGLSERFLFCNDDVFIARPSTIDDWFDGQKLRLRFTETAFEALETLEPNEVLYRARWKTKALADSKGWHVSDRMPQHAAYPLSKKILTEIWRLFPKELEQTSAARFRSSEAVLPELLACYFAIGNNLAAASETSSYKYVPMNEASGIAPLIDLALKPNHFLSICLNDVSVVSGKNSISDKALEARYRRTLAYLLQTVSDRK
jgi:hypothetical protein